MPRKTSAKAQQKEPTVAGWKGTGTLQSRANGSLRVRVKVHGRTRSLTFDPGTRMAKMKQEAADLERELREEIQSRRARRMRISALLKEFKTLGLAGLTSRTVAAYRDSLKAIRLYFVDGHRDGHLAAHIERDPWVHDVDEAEVMRFMAWRSKHRFDGKGSPRAGAVAPRTVNKDRAVLHKLLEIGRTLHARKGDNPAGQVDRYKEPDFLPTILSPAQIDNLLEACRKSRQPMLYPFAVVLADSGVRSEKEALYLTWASVDLQNRCLKIMGKGEKVRVVPMSRRLSQVLTDHVARYGKVTYKGQRSRWVFHHTVTRRHHRAGERIKSMRESFKNAARRAGLNEELRQHDMRHSAATNWLAAGASQKKVQDILGHTNPKMTDRYTHLIAEHLRDVVDLTAADPGPEDAT